MLSITLENLKRTEQILRVNGFEKIVLRNCDIQTISSLDACKELHLHKCRSLEFLPPLPNCEKLTIDMCFNLKTLPELPKCRFLTLSLTDIEKVPALPHCKSLNISHVKGERMVLPDLPKCEKVVLYGLMLEKDLIMPSLQYESDVAGTAEKRNA